MTSDTLTATVVILERGVATSIRPYAPAGVMQPIEDDWSVAQIEIEVQDFVPHVESMLGLAMELDDDEAVVAEYKPRSDSLVVRLGLISLDPI